MPQVFFAVSVVEGGGGFGGVVGVENVAAKEVEWEWEREVVVVGRRKTVVVG